MLGTGATKHILSWNSRGKAAKAPAQNHVEELGDFQTPWIRRSWVSIIEERLSQEIQNVLLTSIQ